MLLDDDQQLRYSRHLLLDEWSEAAQQRLLNAHALVIGAGGLGAPALMYLASCGVGRITVVDPDTVMAKLDLAVLNREIAAIHVANFKAFGKTVQRFPIAPITLVFGPNSAGKSSLMQALLFASHVQATRCHIRRHQHFQLAGFRVQAQGPTARQQEKF